MGWLDTSKKVLIPFSTISHISKKVTEQISSKYLHDFLKTSLLQEDISLSANSKIFYTYLEKENMYEIYLFETTHNQPILEFQLFENYPDFEGCTDKYFLFITPTFFVVYLNNHPLFAFENKNYTKEDIIKFIEFTHKIDIYKTINIDKDLLTKQKEQFQNHNTLPLHNPNSSYQFFYYLIYCTLIVFVSFYFYYENISQHNIQTLPNTKDDTTYTNKKITNKIATFINNLSIHHIKLEKVHYNKKKLHSTILATNQNLYNFLALYKKNHTIVKLEKVDETLFIAEIEIEF